LFANLPFNPARDFAPIIEVAEMLNVVTVHPSVPVSNMRELVQLIKSQPGVVLI
jgi:tripartite-type tricarboxylate transporter receptor subunit TctC